MIRDPRAPRSRGARAGSGRALTWLLLPWMAACSTVAPLDASLPGDGPRRVELTATPFFPQEEHQCGPAALATVLAASGVPVVPGDLVAGTFLPGREGSLQAELVAAARRQGRLAYELPGDPGSLIAELAAGRPVLVLQNLGVDAYPRWHYAVLVGLDAGRDAAILRSGRRQREVMSWARFDASWRRGGRWAVVVLEPGVLPESADPLRFLEATAGLEAAGRLEDAAVSYAAATARWPDHALTHLGLGNNAYARGDLGAAVASYQRGVVLAPGNAALHNNLAQALLDAGCPRQAEAEARTAAMLAAGTPLEVDARGTLQAIESGPRQEGHCAIDAGGSAAGQPLSSGDDREARAADR